jgi:hypothetical protein
MPPTADAKATSAKDRTIRAQARDQWKVVTTIWLGIESGIRTFCTDVGISSDKFLSGWAAGLPESVEKSRMLLDVRGRADAELAARARQQLRDAWQVGSDEWRQEIQNKFA